jgi:hypothetical protein
MLVTVKANSVIRAERRKEMRNVTDEKETTGS